MAVTKTMHRSKAPGKRRAKVTPPAKRNMPRPRKPAGRAPRY